MTKPNKRHSWGSTHVTWQGTTVICSFIVIGILGYVWFSVPRDNLNRSDDKWFLWCISILLLLAATAIYSRIHYTKTRERKLAILIKVVIGLLLSAGGTALMVLFHKPGTSFEMASVWLDVLVITGIVVIANALNPRIEQDDEAIITE